MYNNAYNKNIAERVKRNIKKHIARQEEADKMGDTSFTSHLEGAALRDHTIEGGSGYAAATLRDEGFQTETTNGVVGSGEPEVKKKRTRKTKLVGSAILGLADIETEPRGDPPVQPPLVRTGVKASKSKLQDDTLKLATEATAKLQDDTLISGGSKKKRMNKYAQLVKEIMQQNNIKSLAEASKYIKANNLYTKQ